MNPEIFREYDIRGVVNTDYDATFAYDLGRSFATYLKHHGVKDPLNKVTVGHDARSSSPELYEALIKGLTDSGIAVLKLGLISTPMSYFSTFALKVGGAVMITGSHNPPEYNGFKVSYGTSTIFGEEIQKLKHIIVGKDFIQNAAPAPAENHDIFPAYLDRYASEIKLDKPVKVVIDCGNGCAGVVVRKLLNRIGIDPEIMFEEPDGTFPNHHPDPTVEKNMVALSKRVIDVGAIAGIGFDGDADRIGVVDEKGHLIYGDELMVIFARSVLAANPGTAIIGDVKCSDRMYKDIEAHGGVPVMYKTGHSLIKNKMKEMKSKFSGEMSGHVCFADRNYGYDDAVYAGARFIEILSQTGKSVSQLLEGLPPAFGTPEIRIDTTDDKKWKIVDGIKEQFAKGQIDSSTGKPYKVNEIDGIRISFEDGFGLVRASNTQPVLVCRFEATTEKRRDEIRSLIEGAVKKLL